MTPAARLQAAADILDLMKGARRPAEEVLKDWGRGHRYAGSKDRRAIADKVYQSLRGRERLAHFMGDDSGRALVIGALHLQDGLTIAEIDALYTGDGYAPPRLTVAERGRLEAGAGEVPAWLAAGLPEFAAERLKTVYGDGWLAEAEALMLPRAPIDLRVNGDREPIRQGLEMLGYKPEVTPYSRQGLRLPAEPPPNIRTLPAFKQGLIEIQDEGSQIISFLAGAQPGMTVVDYCAGGGGKTLGLLQAMGGEGRLIASDIDRTRLNNIKPRLARAGLHADLRQLGPSGEGMEDLEGSDGKGLADLVMVDAPCSGSGVWRRRPETAALLEEKEVRRLHELQVAILRRAAKLVKPGGRLVYATCSILPDEDEETIAAFEHLNNGFTPLPISEAAKVPQLDTAGLAALANGHSLRLSPHMSHTDGFFVATYERRL